MTAGQLLPRSRRSLPDALVLDVGLPGLDGLAVSQRLRGKGLAVPVLLLTARDAVADRVKGLDAGADDYLVKPFATEELLARLRALLRAGAGSRKSSSRSTISCSTSRPGRPRAGRPCCPLSRRETDLLELLLRHPRRLVRPRAGGERDLGRGEPQCGRPLRLESSPQAR